MAEKLTFIKMAWQYDIKYLKPITKGSVLFLLHDESVERYGIFISYTLRHHTNLKTVIQKSFSSKCKNNYFVIKVP